MKRKTIWSNKSNLKKSVKGIQKRFYERIKEENRQLKQTNIELRKELNRLNAVQNRYKLRTSELAQMFTQIRKLLKEKA